MPKVDVSLNGRIYPVVCEEGQQDRVMALARQVDETLARIRPAAQGATDSHLLVLTALTLADRASDLTAEVDRVQAEMDALRAQVEDERANAVPTEEQEQVTAAVEHLTRRVEDIAARLRSA